LWGAEASLAAGTHLVKYGTEGLLKNRKVMSYCAPALAIVVALAFSAGALWAQKLGTKGSGETFKTEGWVDDDTFRVVALGMPAPELSDPGARKEHARRAALLNAQFRMHALLGGNPSGPPDLDLMTLLAGVKEVRTVFDAEQNCEGVFELRASGLRKKTGR